MAASVSPDADRSNGADSIPEIRTLSQEIDLKSLLTDAIEMSPVAMVVADRSGVVRGWNRAAEEIFGWTREEVLGKKTPFVTDQTKEHSAAFKKRIWAGEVVSNRHHVRNHKSGAELDVKLSACPIKNRRGEVVGSLGIVQDITKDLKKQRNLELTVMSLQRELDMPHRKKVNFLSYLSHEMRTPLTAIQGQIDQFRLVRDQMLAASGLPTGSRLNPNSPFEKLMTDIREHTEHLHALIGEAISFSEFDADHKQTVEVGLVDMDRLEESMESAFPQVLVRQNSAFKSDMQKFELYSDAKMLKQVLYNLLYNSIKFTENGTIHLTAELSADHTVAKFRVRDDGVGISTLDRDKIFEAFEKGSHRPKLSEGSGLGLALSRNMARKMGGDLVLEESELGVGSTFLLTVKRDLRDHAHQESKSTRSNNNPSYKTNGQVHTKAHNRVKKKPASDTHELGALLSESPLAGCKVLIAEDADVIRGLFESVLGTAGAKVISAKNGQECLDLWKSEQPDLILLDIKMPVMDGWTAIRRIRAEDEHLPVLAVTASVLGEELQKSYQAGFTEVVSKPVNWVSLVKLMVKLNG
jgi:PAS domain S-box-containing protein